MSESGPSQATVGAALSGDAAAVRALVGALSPVVHARVARAMIRCGARARQGRDVRQGIEDFTQEVFASLFDNDGRTLRGWDPAKGLSLANFVGLVTEHQVASILRSGRRSPWTEEPMVSSDLDEAAGASDDTTRRVFAREVLEALHDRLRAELSPRGLWLFQLLIVEERSVEAVCQQADMSADAVYAWRSRLGKRVRALAHEIAHDPSSNPMLSARSSEGGPKA